MIITLGEIPTGIHALRKLEFLFLNNNQLTGQVPDWIGDFDHLIDFNLLCNKFTGNASLRYFNKLT